MKIHVKVWTSDLKECEQFVVPCHSTLEREVVSRFVAILEAKFPGNTFKTIPVGAHHYNVVPETQASA